MTNILMKVIQNNRFKMRFVLNIQQFCFVLSLKWTVTMQIQFSFLTIFCSRWQGLKLTLVLRELKISTKTCSSVPIPCKFSKIQK